MTPLEVNPIDLYSNVSQVFDGDILYVDAINPSEIDAAMGNVARRGISTSGELAPPDSNILRPKAQNSMIRAHYVATVHPYMLNISEIETCRTLNIRPKHCHIAQHELSGGIRHLHAGARGDVDDKPIDDVRIFRRSIPGDNAILRCKVIVAIYDDGRVGDRCGEHMGKEHH